MWCVWVLIPLPLCVWLRVTAFRTSLCNPTWLRGTRSCAVMDLIHGRFENWLIGWSGDLYQFMQEDQIAIRIQNHIISCECLLLYYFPYLSLSVVFKCYLYHFMWPSDLFYQYDYAYHFMRYRWAFTLIIVYQNAYQRHFMWWLVATIISGLIVVYLRPWLNSIY